MADKKADIKNNDGKPEISFKSISGVSEDMITGENIFKSYRNNGTDIEILKGVDFSIKLGETIAVVGASGIGKSTFLQIIGTLDRPDMGTLMISGEDVFQLKDDSLADFRNRYIGFVFQFHYLLPEFSALENTMMPALINGQNRHDASESAESILVRVGLKERLSHRVSELSGGEQQRVALARAIVLRPPVLLADEPTGNLDKKNSEQVHELLMELNSELSMTMVVVTHNMDLAAYMSRSITIVDGQLIET
jgi:lipoprotein-releasing system ATP-binding protein